MKNGILNYKPSNGKNLGEYSFEFSKDHIPNSTLKAVWYDGSRLRSTNTVLKYDFYEQGLKITIKTDKTDYKPGDNVIANIQVSDKNNKPVKCDVNLSVVDEAFFALYPQEVNTLNELYEPYFPSGLSEEYMSIDEIFNHTNGVEGGEGGDKGGLRSVFKDSACFETITTDDSGKGIKSFKLPDNLTSWRLTYQGVSNDLKAGDGKISVNVNIPYFVNLIFKDVFLTGDKPTLTLRSFGTSLKNNGQVNYNVTVENSDGAKKSFNAVSRGNDFCNIPIEGLFEGNYHIVAEGKFGNLKDGVQRDFRVVDNLLEASKVDYFKLNDSLKFEPRKSLTNLLFYNEENTEFFSVLNSMIFEWGERVDQRLSRKIANELYEKYFEKNNYYIEDKLDMKRYQIGDGGIALLTYDSSNPEVSAKAVVLAKDSFDSFALRGYFYGILDDKKLPNEDHAAAFWGLAALNEPVILDIKNFLKQPDLSDKAKLELSLALAEVGDYSSTLESYKKTIDTDRKIKTSGNLSWFDTQNRDHSIELTALCGAIATRLNLPEKMGFFKYVTDNSTNEILSNFEKLYFIKHSSPNMQQEVKFTYEIDGKKQEVTLSKNKNFGLTLTSDKLSKIKFSNILGNVTVAATSILPIKDSVKDTDKLLELERKYSVNDLDTKAFKQSDFVKIILTPKFKESAPDGYYEIVDVLPAGLSFCTPREEYRQQTWFYGIDDGQKVSFGYSYVKGKKQESIVYYARAVVAGNYTSDFALIKHSRSELCGFSEKAAITVKN